MYKRQEQQRDIVCAVRKGGQIQCVALNDAHLFLGLGVRAEHLDVVFDQLHRVHGVALLRERVGVAAGSRADFKHAAAGGQVFPDVMHGGQKLNRSVREPQPAVLVIVAVSYTHLDVYKRQAMRSARATARKTTALSS